MTVDAHIEHPDSNPEDVGLSDASSLVEHRLEHLLTPLNPSTADASPKGQNHWLLQALRTPAS